MLFLAGGVDEANQAQAAFTNGNGVSTAKLWTKTGHSGNAGVYAWGNFGTGGTITIEYQPYPQDVNSWQPVATLTAASPNFRGQLPNGRYRIRTTNVTGPSLTVQMVPA